MYSVNVRICSAFLCSPVLVDRHTDHVYDIELAHFDFERLFWGYDVAGETTTMVRLSFLKHQYHHSQSDTLTCTRYPSTPGIPKAKTQPARQSKSMGVQDLKIYHVYMI